MGVIPSVPQIPRPSALAAIRHNTHTGRPLGSAEFLRAVEGQTKRRLALQKRAPKRAAEPGKNVFVWGLDERVRVGDKTGVIVRLSPIFDGGYSVRPANTRPANTPS